MFSNNLLTGTTIFSSGRSSFFINLKYTVMKTFSAIIAFAASLSLLTFCTQKEVRIEQRQSAAADTSMEAMLAHGKYLVTISGCHDCHSPKKMGPQGPELIDSLLLSGYPSDRPIREVDANAVRKGWALLNEDLTMAAGPWGVSFAANITSDETGIGTWTEEQFSKALKQGWYKGIEGGRKLLPPMPWQNFTEMKDEDVRAMYLYLKSTRPVRNIVPSPVAPRL